MKSRITAILSILMLAALACNMPSVGKTSPTASATPKGADLILTQVALTVEAQLGVSTATASPAPQDTSTPSPTDTPAAQATPTSSGPVPTSATKCNQAAYVQDVTIPDGSKMLPGQAFTKTWRLKNTSSCTWPATYSVVFVSGDGMSASTAATLPGSIPPGGTFDFSIDLKAPTTAGKFTAYFKLRDSAGAQFGTGAANKPFFVQIEVVGVTPTTTATVTATSTTANVVYDFTAHLCDAEWRSQPDSVLPCPGSQGDTRGYALTLSNPQLETGTNEANPVILNVPQAVKDGAITGKYPVIAFEQGQHFRAALGCVYGASQCSVIYQVNVIINSGQPSNLGQWAHPYTGSVQGIDIDLSSLAGQSGQIVLVVLANGPMDNDQAVWIFPRIVKP